MTRKRVTKMELYMRKVNIERMLVKGYSENEIVDEMSQAWSCTKANVRHYVKEIRKEWLEIDKADPQELRHKYLLRLEMMFKIAWEANHLKASLEIQKEINRLTGMYSSETGDTNTVEVITISERRPATPMLNPGHTDEDDDAADV